MDKRRGGGWLVLAALALMGLAWATRWQYLSSTVRANRWTGRVEHVEIQNLPALPPGWERVP